MLGHTKEYGKAALPIPDEESGRLSKNRLVSGILKNFLTDELICLAENPKLG